MFALSGSAKPFPLPLFPVPGVIAVIVYLVVDADVYPLSRILFNQVKLILSHPFYASFLAAKLQLHMLLLLTDKVTIITVLCVLVILIGGNIFTVLNLSVLIDEFVNATLLLPPLFLLVAVVVVFCLISIILFFLDVLFGSEILIILILIIIVIVITIFILIDVAGRLGIRFDGCFLVVVVIVVIVIVIVALIITFFTIYRSSLCWSDTVSILLHFVTRAGLVYGLRWPHARVHIIIRIRHDYSGTWGLVLPYPTVH
mmetsp:Transcript_15376/g.25463  ORF Transcript_15376/g.25463 Transcript_15376/m.25463 type:complete len:257 (+) Transcript_15376:296-1066(+)